MNPQIIFSILVLFGFVIVPIVPPLLILRGQRFWAPWLMLGSVGLFILAVGANLGLQYYFSQQIQKITAASATGALIMDSPEWGKIFAQMRLTAVLCGGTSVLSLLTYSAGLWGVASRWGELSRRAKSLEAVTANLAQRREGVASR
ncbi:hypothetical protein AAFN60_08540 [Roseibacillus persicicus]|uniref:hypothetical protein n=1 Tax=Roseibacillus persicicus TaxID=454148 RepID=UPI00398AF729